MNKEVMEKLYGYKATGHVFGLCCKDWVIVFKKTDQFEMMKTKHDIKDENYAALIGSELEVVDIVHKFDINQRTVVTYNHSWGGISRNCYFRIGKIHTIYHYYGPSNDKYEYCCDGIPYYNDPKPAFYYGLESVDDGLFERWYDNGIKEKEYAYVNCKLHGTCREWHANGEKQVIQHYENGKLHGTTELFDTQGNMYRSANHKNGLADGEIRTHSHGMTQVEIYDNGIIKEITAEFCSNGKLIKKIVRKYDKEINLLDGLYEETKETYTDGKLVEKKVSKWKGYAEPDGTTVEKY